MEITENISEQNAQDSNLVKPLVKEAKPLPKNLLLGLAVLIIVMGVITGYAFTGGKAEEGRKAITKTEAAPEAGDAVEVGKAYGRTDANFKDSAEGIIKEGGVNGEGTHQLWVDGDENRVAALTSSVLDLDLFADRRVEICGETFKAQKAAWLLDVGVVRVLE